jgi:hypothetical protein
MESGLAVLARPQQRCTLRAVVWQQARAEQDNAQHQTGLEGSLTFGAKSHLCRFVVK